MSDHLFVVNTFQKQLEGVELVPAEQQEQPGLYDANGNKLKSWNKLIADGDVIVTDGIMSTPDDRSTRFANVDTVVIDSSVTRIGTYTFDKCINLTTIIIPDSVTGIEVFAFGECTNLNTITIPDSVTSIGNRTFIGCTGLITITIPDSVTSIGAKTFHNCTNLTTIYYSGTATGAPWGATGATVIP